MAEEIKKEVGFFQREITFGKPFSDKLKEAFYTEFGTLTDSGIDMRRSLQLIIEEQEKKSVKAIIESLLEKVISGSSLSEAMEQSNQFTVYEYQSVRIGEETGRMVHVLQSLAQFYGDKVKLRRQMIGVFTYPVFVLLITFGVLYFMLSYVVPMFKDVFKQFGQELPALTQKVVWLSEHFGGFMFYFLIIAVSGGTYLYLQRKEIWYRKYSTKIMLKIPIFGPLLRKVYTARFCQSMSLLLQAKTPLVRSLDLVEQMIGFYPMEEMIRHAKNEIVLGNPLYLGLSPFDIVDKRFVSLIKIAEEINELDTTFVRLGKQYNDEIDYRTKLIGTIIEPAIIVIIGLVVGVIMVAMYMPMFNLSNVIK